MFLDILEILVEGALSVIDAKVDIPVISLLYKKITGSDLTFLDTVCLAVAIYTTITFKTLVGKSPFSADNLFDKKVIAADSWQTLQMLYANGGSDETDRWR